MSSHVGQDHWRIPLSSARAALIAIVLLFAAVHDLVLRDVESELRRFYPNVALEPDRSDPFPAFRDCCLRHHESLTALIATRSTTTPSSGASRPARMLSTVVLPQPEWPMMQTNSPRSTESQRSSNTVVTPPQTAAAEVEHCFTGLEGRYGLGVPTPEHQVRSIRDIGKILARISQSERNIRQWGFPGFPATR